MTTIREKMSVCICCLLVEWSEEHFSVCNARCQSYDHNLNTRSDYYH